MTAKKNSTPEMKAIRNKIDKIVSELKKTSDVSMINFVDFDFLANQIAEDLSKVIASFLGKNNFTHILLPSSTFGKNLGPKIATMLDVQQISDVINIIDHETFERPIYAGNAIAKVKSKDKVKALTRPLQYTELGNK